jgi:hypothetical protein
MKNNKRWSKQDTEYLQEHYNKLDIDKLVVRLERSQEAIRWHASSLGLTEKRTPTTYWSKEEEIYVAENWDKFTHKDMADRLGRTVRSVTHKVHNLRIAKLLNGKSARLDAIENDVPFFEGKTSEYRKLLASLEVNQSFVFPAEDYQTIKNQTKYFPDKVFRTKQEDKLTRRVWRLL